MKDLPHAGLPEKESTVPGPYGQCRTQVARGDIGQNFKIQLGEPICISLVSFDAFFALNGSKLVAKITKNLLKDI